MPYVLCNVEDGLRPSEATVEVKDHEDRSEFLRVDRDYIKQIEGSCYLPVGIVFEKNGLILIELPHEADSGANRLWVARNSIRDVRSPHAAALT